MILNVRVNNRELWQFMFREVYTTITIHRTVFQYITIHGHQKWSITASRKYPCPPPPPPPPLFIVLVREREPEKVSPGGLMEEDINRFAETMSQFF